ncbi:MAG: RIP metalloprotease RseP, partial [Bacteroidota bacterium]
MGILVMIIQFLLGLSIIVGIHELGHLLFAKLFGMRVESYIIGFPPKLFRFQWGETEYALGSVPLGGAVKISGMIDESLDTETLSREPQPWEFRAKPAWQRLIVILGGILFNIVSGVIIYIALTFSLGDTYLPKNEVNKHGIIPSALGISLGFQEGDQIIGINGQDFERFADVLKPSALLATNGYYTVRRNGQDVRIAIPANLIEQLADTKNKGQLVAPRLPFKIGQVQPNSEAAQAGLQSGDQLVEVAGVPVQYFHQIQAALAAHAGRQIAIRYMRAGEAHTATAEVSAEGTLGFQPQFLLEYAKKNYTLGQAITTGTWRAYEIMESNLKGLGKVITGKISASKSLSGPIGIVKVFGRTFHWVQFWSMTAFLSLALALTNLLPIPALD